MFALLACACALGCASVHLVGMCFVDGEFIYIEKIEHFQVTRGALLIKDGEVRHSAVDGSDHPVAFGSTVGRCEKVGFGEYRLLMFPDANMQNHGMGPISVVYPGLFGLSLDDSAYEEHNRIRPWLGVWFHRRFTR